jgi:hypothetical protein
MPRSTKHTAPYKKFLPSVRKDMIAVLSHDMYVTSAHCLYFNGANGEPKGWRPRRRIVFQAGSLEKRDVGTSCYQAYVPNGFKLGFSDLDYAVIRFRGGGAHCAQDTYDVGYLDWATFIDTPGTVSMATMGYPGRRYVKPTWVQIHYPVLTYQNEPWRRAVRRNGHAQGWGTDVGPQEIGTAWFQPAGLIHLS